MLSLIKEKCVYILVLLLIIAGVVLYIKYQNTQIITLEQKLLVTEISRQNELKFYNIEIEKAKKTIDEQNTAIEEFRLDRERYETVLHEEEKQLLMDKVKIQSYIQNELNKDSSLENQFKLIVEILKEFGYAN